MNENWVVGGIAAAAGAFSMVAAIANWDWFILTRKAQLFVKLLGRNGARGFYFVFGLALAVFGVLMMLGVLDTKTT